MTSENTALASGSTTRQVRYRFEKVGDVDVFYREAGDPNAPTVLLLHGFAASSYMWRDVIEALADGYHVVAPDLPAFGFTQSPARGEYDYTFANLTKTTDQFTEQLGLDRYAIAVHDYGAPVGWRLALAHPSKITAIISQNGNTYEEGLSQGWAPIQTYWNDPSKTNRDALSDFPTPASIKWQYVEGVSDTSAVAPDAYTLEGAKISQPGMADIQLDLLLDYATNVAKYPEFQAYFRAHQPPLLAVWGKHDPFFLPPGAEAWKRDIPQADIRFYDTGHFALETHGDVIIPVIREFLDNHLKA
ncbi:MULTISPECIES: alpha/beta fold hydrolase [unclassified Halomonas]|uniref:alpha/beta fold hydrolase n=1 Tax=unclassified Halomonas TaxID=2609666 RepID=UPI0006DBB408|nr:MULTISPECIES: alpha/beta hydrolase [unclassified Halomonas]KPQ20237.1 MAG: putative hydrolases or acyltransferases (alpha/beta hydrolase superfamily) [Halomonas sp. HL-93]SBR51044.1 Pimeloyl-ACP methyl ester carboxylesterase [Halomonas sp. HL-93]SNY97166.1 Pimeloyl-ACP methyl ester carboxylesterase [Halomonas sp. hl-4]